MKQRREMKKLTNGLRKKCCKVKEIATGTPGVAEGFMKRQKISLILFAVLKPIVIVTLAIMMEREYVGIIPFLVRLVGAFVTVFAMLMFINFAGLADQLCPYAEAVKKFMGIKIIILLLLA